MIQKPRRNLNNFKSPKRGFLLAFGELFLKSEGVRKILKRSLANHLIFFLNKEEVGFKLHQFRERFFIEIYPASFYKTKRCWAENFKKASKIIQNTFGLAWFSQTFFLKNGNLKDLSQFIKNNYQNWIKENQTFALRIRKGGEIKESREEIIKEIAKRINRKVNLDKPNKEIFIEGRKDGWFVYFKKQKGLGGLPMGSQGRVITLFSGGIDSPAAAWLTAKRGAENIWLHFHSFPLVSKKSIEKTEELAKIFINYQPKLKVYYISFHKIQLQIKTKAPAKYRVLLYRRVMLKIAEKIAGKENCGALITGESLGQVSSQTMTNLGIIEESVKMPVLRPLIGLDKEEIITLAKKIGTYEISIKPQEDCCSLFVPKHPTASGKLEIVKKLEKKINLDKLIQKTLKQTKMEFF